MTTTKQNGAVKTKVIFRILLGDPIALFPQDAGTNDPYTCSSYMHNGQHSSADPDLVISCSEPATPKQYRPLAKELRRIGYQLQIVTRQNRSADIMARRKQIIF